SIVRSLDSILPRRFIVRYLLKGRCLSRGLTRIMLSKYRPWMVWKSKRSMDANEDNELLLSGIQHYRFCKRQWALIHIEQQWEEDVRTIEGSHLHKKADQPLLREKRGDKLIVRAMPVRSASLGITGVCDVVEFVRSED